MPLDLEYRNIQERLCIYFGFTVTPPPFLAEKRFSVAFTHVMKRQLRKPDAFLCEYKFVHLK